jgi:hypothetical protein
MKSPKSHLIHWFVTVAVAVGSLSPVISQAISLNSSDHGFAMEICSIDGGKMEMQVKTDFPSDQKLASHECFLCNIDAHYAPSIHSGVTFERPQAFSLFPKLFYQSPKPINVWVTPPSAAPPTQA